MVLVPLGIMFACLVLMPLQSGDELRKCALLGVCCFALFVLLNVR